MKITALFAAVAVSATVLSATVLSVAPASAQDIQVVAYDDLNLASVDGTAQLENRIERAIRSVCERPDLRNVQAAKFYHDCTTDARAQVQAELERNGIAL